LLSQNKCVDLLAGALHVCGVWRSGLTLTSRTKEEGASMNFIQNLCGVASAALAFAATSPSAIAQEITAVLTCQNVGGVAPEPLGDREGHSILIGPYSCRIDSGPMSGGVLTGTAIWEWDGPNAVLLTASGVERKPDATAVYVEREGKLALTMADGKVTGWAALGRGTYSVATGSAASLAGKSYTFAAKPTGAAGQFTVEVKVE
jgi:hypothetical protein